jgi:hypothetical protein
VCSVAERILELERELASQSEELVDLQANLLSILREKVGNEALFWGRGEYYWIYLLDVGVMNVPVP